MDGSDPGMGSYHPHVRRSIGLEPQSNVKSASGVGVSSSCGAAQIREMFGFCPRVAGVVVIRRDSGPAMRRYRLRRNPRVRRNLTVVPRGNSHCAVNQPVGLGFPHLAGGIDPGNFRFRPRVVDVVDLLNVFYTGDRTLSSLGAARPRRCPGRQLSLRACSIKTPFRHKSVNVVEFPHLAGRYRPGACPFSSLGCWSRRFMEIFSDPGMVPYRARVPLAPSSSVNK